MDEYESTGVWRKVMISEEECRDFSIKQLQLLK